MKAFIIGFGFVLLSAVTAMAEDCGELPGPMPSVPDGATAEREDMIEAVDAVQSYSEEVDAFLACKDKRARTVFQWMTEDQRKRWNEDLDELHNERVELQTRVNEEIRTFNARVDQQDEDDVS